jgi:hypothetical protein
VNRPGPESLTIEVPLTFKKRGGRKQMITPDGRPVSAASSTSSSAGMTESVSRALARAHRWKEMLERGTYGSITDLAQDEKVNRSYLCRVLRLTLLAPNIAEAILDGLLEKHSLNQLMQPFAPEWDQQHSDLDWTPRPSGPS